MAGGTIAGATTALVPGSFCFSGVFRNDVGAIALAPCMTFCEFIASAVIAAVAAFSSCAMSLAVSTMFSALKDKVPAATIAARSSQVDAAFAFSIQDVSFALSFPCDFLAKPFGVYASFGIQFGKMAFGEACGVVDA